MNDASFEYAERVNSQNWNEFLARDRELAVIELAIARAARILSSEYQGSPIHAEAHKEYQRAMDARRALFTARYRKP